jgi:hypothetical protein
LNIFKISTLPATGVQLYYEKPFIAFKNQIVAGSMAKHPWGISYVDQSCYWDNPEKYCGKYGVISIYTAITNQAGKYIKKPMIKCTANEVAYEMFTEIENDFKKRGFHIPKRIGFCAHSYTDKKEFHQNEPSILYHFADSLTQDQLHLCTLGMWQFRPQSDVFYLGNIILCGAYTQNHTFFVSTMESASESGRRGANAILLKMNLSPIKICEVPLPKHIHLFRKFDQLLYQCFLPNPLDLLLKLFRKILNTSKVHMDLSVQKHEDLHW